MPTASYCGSPPVPADLAGRWNGDPLLILILGAALLLFLARGDYRRAAGILVLAVAFVSPLCALSVALFSARTVDHLLLFSVAAPLLTPAGRWRAPPVAAFLLSTAALWAWHVPALYDAALSDTAAYWLMQASLLGGGLLFWQAVRGMQPAGALGLILAGMAQMGFLGALLTFAPHPIYAAHITTTLAFGLSPLADQQLSGLLMWIVGLLPYGLAAGRAVAPLLSESAAT